MALNYNDHLDDIRRLAYTSGCDTHQNKEECDEQRHPALDVLAGNEERRPADHDEQRAGQVVRDHVVRHPTCHRHLEARNAVVTYKIRRKNRLDRE